MSYKVGQYNNTNSKLNIATYVTSGEIIEIPTAVGNITFKDYGLKLGANLSNEENYYLHLRIKKMTSSVQEFSIKLKSSQSDITEEQYIAQNIKVNMGESGWEEVELVFNPIISAFNIIEVELVKTVADYSNPRKPYFIFEELSIITNLMNGSYLPTNPIVKIGVQTHPGFEMCLNGESILVGRSGLYEMRNGKVYITFFSPLSASVDSEIDEHLVKNETVSLIGNVSCKTRTVDKFTVDYIYEEDN